ncbi:MAG: AAA family ATPase [Solirubrobacteraceae bacterium]
MAETKAERHAWELLTHDFRWDPPADFGVKVRRNPGAAPGPAKLQVFEVAVAAIFSRLRPDYEWCVTPNLPDGGSDFIGRQQFLQDEVLGIAAAITVGGQCKKRGKIGNVVHEVAGSLVDMVATINPTFFVVALSARLKQDRIEQACARVELAYQRHCHILDRPQIEGMFNEHITLLEEILCEDLSPSDVRSVLDYLDTRRDSRLRPIAVSTPDRVLAGVPFTITVRMGALAGNTGDARLWWQPHPTDGTAPVPVTLIAPLGADSLQGSEFFDSSTADDPMRAHGSIELLTYAVGEVDLGEIRVGRSELTSGAQRIALGATRVVENMRPRFFEAPFRASLKRLADDYDRAMVSGIACVGVLGAGGSGKSRVCDEFALDKRRRGARIIRAHQAKTSDDQQRILAELFLSLATEEPSPTDPAATVIRAIAQYDMVLAGRAEPAVRSLFGVASGERHESVEQSLVSALIVLIVAATRESPVIVHLQDLHWCNVELLQLLEGLIWQLEVVLTGTRVRRGPQRGALLLLEGRMHERQGLAEEGWSSEQFEIFLGRVAASTVVCSSFTPAQSHEFISRLFERTHTRGRVTGSHLPELQAQLVEEIDRSAGGNPFHSLEQVRFLKDNSVIGQNRATGLLYLIRPPSVGSPLPDTVFEAIRRRWDYLHDRKPDLALLIRATALVEDHIPSGLFEQLRAELAPNISLGDVDSTEMLWTAEDERAEVTFRHENYFRSIRKFAITPADRERVVGVYVGWYESAGALGPADSFRLAQALLELPRPDPSRIHARLRTALRGARREGDLRLARRIAADWLDLRWSNDVNKPLDARAFLRCCDDELEFTGELLGSDRQRASIRLTALSERVHARVISRVAARPQASRELRRREFAAQVLRSQILFNDRQPSLAADVAHQVVSDIRAISTNVPRDEAPAWETIDMEALHSEAVALALAGEIDAALERSRQAVLLAEDSTSARALNVIATYANILLARDPETSESILRDLLERAEVKRGHDAVRDQMEINLAMALVVRTHDPGSPGPDAALTEARGLLARVFGDAFRLGRYPDAAAAALMLGVIAALAEDGNEASWFAQAVTAATRGRQMETLWRAHVNFATALHVEGNNSGTVCDHARAALEIMRDTLSPYPDPDDSMRFALLQAPMAQAVRLLLRTDDELAVAILERHPRLRTQFSDLQTGTLADIPEATRSHEWIRIGEEGYVLY